MGHTVAYRIDDDALESVRWGSLPAGVPNEKSERTMSLISGCDMKVFGFGYRDGEPNYAEVGGQDG